MTIRLSEKDHYTVEEFRATIVTCVEKVVFLSYSIRGVLFTISDFFSALFGGLTSPDITGMRSALKERTLFYSVDLFDRDKLNSELLQSSYTCDSLELFYLPNTFSPECI